jgi:hypothetical protein
MQENGRPPKKRRLPQEILGDRKGELFLLTFMHDDNRDFFSGGFLKHSLEIARTLF